MTNNTICISCGRNLPAKYDTSLCERCLLGLNLRIGEDKAAQVLDELNNILANFPTDIAAAFNKDPAARSIVEVLTAHPRIQGSITMEFTC